MHIRFALALLLSSAAAFADVSVVLFPSSAQELYGNPMPDSAVPPREALEAVEIFPIGMGSESELANAVLVSESTSVLTNFGDYTSYAYPVEFENALYSQIIQVNGYLIKPPKGKKYILYPIITAFDQDKNLLGTLLPASKSEISGNTIENFFSVQTGTKYLLIHTDPRLVTFDMDSGQNIDSDNVSAGIASLGGALGGIFNGVLFNSQVKRGEVGVAPVGVAEVMSVSR